MDNAERAPRTDPRTALLAAGPSIAAAASVPAVLQAVCDAVPIVFRAEQGYTFEVRGSEPILGPWADQLDRALVNQAIATRRVVTTRPHRGGPGQSALCAPIFRGTKVAAALYVPRGEVVAGFDEEEHWLATFLAAMAGATLEHVAESEAHFRSLVRNSHDLTMVADASGRALYVSPSVTRILGYSPFEMAMLPALDLVHPDDRELVVNAFRLSRFSPASHPTAEVRARHSDGSWRWLELTLSNLLADPSIRGLVFNIRDITDRRSAEDRLTFLALHDPLTGLPNRRLLLDRLALALARAQRVGRMVAVLYVDLDHFKAVNDSMGHDCGDQLLRQVAFRLALSVRDCDTVARLGGDEFVLVVDDLSNATEALLVAQRIEESLAQPFYVAAGVEVQSPASIGIVVATGRDEPDILLRQADAAMYQAKQRGRARHHLFDTNSVGRAT